MFKINKIKVDFHCMIDIECLAQSSNAAILTVGAVCFDPYANDIEDVLQNKIEKGNFTTFYKKVDIDSCTDINLDIEDGTMAWWAKQSQDAVDEAFSENDRETLTQVLKDLSLFSRHAQRFWAKSPQYDMSILENAAKKLGVGVSWNYHQLRDVRTIEELTGLETKSSNSHKAVDDALNQAMMIQKAYQKLGLVRPTFD